MRMQKCDNIYDLINNIDFAEIKYIDSNELQLSIRCKSCYIMRPSKQLNSLNDTYGVMILKKDVENKSVINAIRGKLKKHDRYCQSHQLYKQKLLSIAKRESDAGDKCARIAWFVIMNKLPEVKLIRH